MPIKRALISVSDKSGIIEFAQVLVSKDIEIISTGGTAKLLKDKNIPVTEVSEYTGYPEMMAGRVKTLNPIIHGGILARRGVDEKVMAENDIKPIDLVVVNLYPFQSTIDDPDCSIEDAIENIDIGGPAMLRSSAKNYLSVTVVVDCKDYQLILNELNDNNDTSLETRRKLALKTFEHTAQYDGAIANYLGQEEDGFSNTLNLQFVKSQTMRYGENPHQNAAFYKEIKSNKACISSSKQIQGNLFHLIILLMLMRLWNVFAILIILVALLLNMLIHVVLPLEKAFYQPTNMPIKQTQLQHLVALSPLTGSWIKNSKKHY